MMMKKQTAWLPFLIPLGGLTACQKEKPAEPNIILILADDMGYSDIGCFGSEINTPNLDRLAAEGLRMTQFYNAARSCPSRAALLTGLYPHQTGVGDMLQNDSLPGYDTHLNFHCVTIAEVLKEAGYSTFICGKWHVGGDEPYWPTKRGFEKQYGGPNTTGHYFGLERTRKFVVEGKDSMPPGEWIKSGSIEYKLMKNEDGSQWYATDAYTNRAIHYIHEHKKTNPGKPFFLYLAYTCPHWPLHAFPEDIARYKGKYLNGGWDSTRVRRYKKMTGLGIIDPSWPLSSRHETVPAWETLSDSEKVVWDHWMAVYAAMIDRMDQNIGKLRKCLEDNGYDKNTMIIFLSDNGGCHEAARRGDPKAEPGSPHSFGGYDYPWANVSNTPFRWFKHWVHEGGISTPFIAWYPGKIKAGTINSQMAHITDIMPTLVEIAGATYPSEYKGNSIYPLPGKSLVPLLTGRKAVLRDTLCWEHEGNRAVRCGKWKLVSRYDYSSNEELPWELYDMEKDRSELHNLAEQHPEKVKEMEQIYFSWASSVGVYPHKKLQERRKEMQQAKRNNKK